MGGTLSRGLPGERLAPAHRRAPNRTPDGGRAGQLPVQQVLVRTLACVRAGLSSSGATEFAVPDSVKMSLEDLRRWSRVLQAGIAAEKLVYGKARGGADDRALLGQLWGLSGHDVDTAQREQRRARREIEQQLRKQRACLEDRAAALLADAPRLGR